MLISMISDINQVVHANISHQMCIFTIYLSIWIYRFGRVKIVNLLGVFRVRLDHWFFWLGYFMPLNTTSKCLEMFAPQECFPVEFVEFACWIFITGHWPNNYCSSNCVMVFITIFSSCNPLLSRNSILIIIIWLEKWLLPETVSESTALLKHNFQRL